MTVLLMVMPPFGPGGMGISITPAASVLYGSRRPSTGLKMKFAFMNWLVPRPEANSFGSPPSVSSLPKKTPR